MLPYFMSSGASESPDLLLSCFVITLALHITILLIITLKSFWSTLKLTDAGFRDSQELLEMSWRILKWTTNPIPEVLLGTLPSTYVSTGLPYEFQITGAARRSKREFRRKSGFVSTSCSNVLFLILSPWVLLLWNYEGENHICYYQLPQHGCWRALALGWWVERINTIQKNQTMNTNQRINKNKYE